MLLVFRNENIKKKQKNQKSSTNHEHIENHMNSTVGTHVSVCILIGYGFCLTKALFIERMHCMYKFGLVHNWS